MIEISNAELALLSILGEKPRHAYDLEKVIEDRNIRNWTDLGFSSIYRILTNLEKKGLLKGKITPPEGRGPARKVYQLTEKGKFAWQKSVLSHLANPDRKYSSFLLALDNLAQIPKEDALFALKKYLNDQIEINAYLSSSFSDHPMKDDFYIQAFFSYILEQQKSEIDWLRSFIEIFEKHTSGV